MFDVEPALDNGVFGGDWTDSPPEGRPGTDSCSFQMSRHESHDELGGGDNEDRDGNKEDMHRNEKSWDDR